MHTVQELVTEVERFADVKAVHQARMAEVTGVRGHNIGIPIAAIEAAQAAGFTWFVKREFVTRFPYSAAAREFDARGWNGVSGKTQYSNERISHNQTRTTTFIPTYTYVGDIPDFALDRMETAIQAGFPYITIHSVEPLPIRVGSIGVRTDPVLVAWALHPHILWDEENHATTLHEQGPSMGLVIAAWDLDKEISVL